MKHNGKDQKQLIASNIMQINDLLTRNQNLI